MLNLEEAYNKTFETIEEIKETGIEVNIVESSARNITSILDEYQGRTDRLPPEKWWHISFVNTNNEEKELIFEKSIELAKQGICFDTGAGCGCIDWEIDWSFHIDFDQIEEQADRLEIVQDLSKNLECEN